MHLLLKTLFIGPILPILNVDDYSQAISFINHREKPLALYVFSNDNSVNEEFINKTSSGSIGINEVLMQISCKFIYLILKLI